LGGHYTTGDGFHKIQWAKQIISGGPLWIDTTTAAPPKYGIGHSLIALPGLAISGALKAHGLHVEAAMYTVLFALNGALLLYVIWLYLSPHYEPRRVWIVICSIGLATSWWPYTKLDFTEVFVVTIFFLAFFLLRKEKTLLGFLCAGFLVLLRSDSIVLVAILFLWHLIKNPTKKQLLLGSTGILPWLAIFGIINFFRFGTFFDHGYANESFSNPLLVGLYGILLSPGKSVFLFSPPVFLGFLGWRLFKMRSRDDALLFLTVFAAQLILYSKWWDWSGDDSWGVRFMLLGVILMTIPMIEILNRKLVVSTLVLGVALQLPAVLVSGLDYVLLVHTHSVQRQRAGIEGTNAVDLEDIRFNPRYSQILGNYDLLLYRLGFNTGRLPSPNQPPTAIENPPGRRPGRCDLDFWWCR
jgi:hypothetical protein